MALDDAVPNTYPDVSLSDLQWDVVLDALGQRGTKRASEIGQRIWNQLAPIRLRHHRGVCRCHPHGVGPKHFDGEVPADGPANR